MGIINYAVVTLPSNVNLKDFMDDLQNLWNVTQDGGVRQICLKRLKILEQRFRVHKILNGTFEHQQQKHNGSTFEERVKVDNHVHAAAMMSRTHLLNFMKTNPLTNAAEQFWSKNEKAAK